nr:Hypothetical protein [Arabidopsis thaliana]
MAKSENSTTSTFSSFANKIQPSNDAESDPDSYALEKFKLYETRARFYLVGSDRNKRFFRVLKIDRSEPSELNISEDPVVYSPQEIKSLLQRIAEGNRATGGLAFVAKVYGIAGCAKFMESYYLVLVTKRRQIGCICGHAIYAIDESQMISVPHATIQSDVANSKTELRYKKLLSSVDLTKDFFYSYTYPIMQSLQKNVLSSGEEGMPYDNIFVWNSYLTQPIRSRCNNTIWTLALVHGHFKQIRLSIYGRDFSVTLVSRRSRHFAGTRYLKRGVNDRGRVANDVETEQLVLDDEAGSCKGKMSSVVQMRGSIPLFWSQEASRFSPKPDIFLQRYDPTYESTKMHFEDLVNRYGNPIIVLNLIKTNIHGNIQTVEKRPREMVLRREFANAVGYLNSIFREENHLKFIHWDFHKFAKSKSANVLAVLGAVASEALDLTGLYFSGKPKIVKKKASQLSHANTARDKYCREPSLRDLRAYSAELSRGESANDILSALANREKEMKLTQQKKDEGTNSSAPRYQSGVLRTNCIDCLDRTNVAQYAYGLAALGRQLHAMGLSDTPKIDPDSSIAAALMDMYQSMGDALAQQYGGSAAHNTEGKPALWELDSDYYLHVSGIGDDIFPDIGVQSIAKPMSGIGVNLAPVPAFRDDFSRKKLTSFDKLIEQTCSSIKNVRLCSETDQRPGGNTGSTGVAPDAAEIQLKSPNWLFGSRKPEESSSATKSGADDSEKGVTSTERVNDFCNLDWLSKSDRHQGDIFQRYLSITSTNEANGWYGGTLLGDQDENSEIYRHYAQFCQCPAMEPFENDHEFEQNFAEVLRMNTIDVMDIEEEETEMESDFNEYTQIGSDLGIIPMQCKHFASDPCWLARWLVGDDKVPKVI